MISAIILAAGKSVRMGQPKMLLPWGKTTVLGKVIETVRSAGVEDIVVVTHSTLVSSLAQEGVRLALNNNGDMLDSIQAGLRAQAPEAEATLICLGDQPQVQAGSVRSVCEAFHADGSRLVVPSYQMRRGHPWLIARDLWGDLLTMTAPATMRDFLNVHASEIRYVECETPSILQDLDTPDDYAKYKPKFD